MKVDESTQLFLLLAWVTTITALLAAIWLVKDIRNVSERLERSEPAPQAIKSAPEPNKWGFTVPPPPRLY